MTVSRDQVKTAAQAVSQELGLFVIWDRARHLEGQILQDLRRRFSVLGVYEIQWTPALTENNYFRFYCNVNVRGSTHLSKKGSGSFVTVVVRDSGPSYAERPTMRGRAVVNANLFDAKDFYRTKLHGHLGVHGTQDLKEFKRDAALLLGYELADRHENMSDEWDGKIRHLERDLPGAEGWTSVTEMFDLLNRSVSYVVLRNFEQLPEGLLANHEDIDLLTDEYQSVVRLLNAEPRLRTVPTFGGRFRVHIRGEDVTVDIRTVGDRYYDRKWSQHLLENRQLDRRGFYRPSGEDYLESLTYHALVHKPSFSAEYRDRLSRMAADLGRANWVTSDHGELVVEESLRLMMHRRGFRFVRPRDPTVYFNSRVAGLRLLLLRRATAKMRRLVYRRWMQMKALVLRATDSMPRVRALYYGTLRKLRKARSVRMST